MKKRIFLFFSLVIIPVITFGQFSGSGTYLDPYTGTLNSSTTWNGRTYFDVINVGAGGNLTISAGATILAVAPTSSITISETGILHAVGTAVDNIIFSADNNGDGAPSIAETWKNILFEYLCSGVSIIDYAIIENGTGDDYTYGGGIDIWGNNITISNSTIKNCNNPWGNGGGISATPSGSNVVLSNLKIFDNTTAGSGGGIFTDGNVTISGCDIYNNTASSGAGIFLNAAGSVSNSLIHNNSGSEAIYSFGTDASASFSNCIIYNNQTGIYFYGERNVVNCSIVNNVTGITSAASTGPKIINSVLWGNTTQYSLEPGSAIELAYCGIQGGFTVGTNGGGNINLSSTNSASTGPNFVDPVSDFHISSAISPLVDNGTASYTGITFPGTDLEGKSYMMNTDIGVYEFQYYIWTGAAGTTVWSTPSNWVGSPATIPTTISENKVIIPRGCVFYPTVSTLRLSSRSTLSIEPQAGLTVTGATNVEAGCTFLIESDATGSGNFISGTQVTGSFNVELFLAGGGNPNFKWHYVTPPNASAPKTVLTTSIGNPYNLLNYIESRVTTDKMAGWNWHDGYNGSTAIATLISTFGYNVYVTTDQTALFTGTVRVGTNFINGNITFTSTDPAQSGWNLIGNPFTCGINANNFNFGSRLDIDKTVYFTRDNQYLAWSVAGDAGINGATNIIPPMQGFFVHAAAPGPGRILGIPATSRVYTTSPLYKKSLESNVKLHKKAAEESRTNPYLKFNVSDGGSLTDESIIYFYPDATTGFDGDYDAYKMLAENPAHPQIYSVSENINLGIDGLPLPDDITTVPVKLRIGVAKNYTINVVDLQNLTDCKVTLIHGSNRVDLKANPSYTFPAIVGTVSDMAIEFDMSVITDINEPSKDQISCWYSKGSVFFKTEVVGFSDNSIIIIYDVNGKVVLSKTDVNLGKGEIVEIPLSLDNGFYIASVNNKNLRLTKKIVISH